MIQIRQTARSRKGDALTLLRRKAVDQRQPIQALAKPPCEIIQPALAAHAAPLADLFHRHAQDQDLVHQRRAISAKLALDAIEAQHGLALAFRDRLAKLSAVDIFPEGIDRLRSASAFSQSF